MCALASICIIKTAVKTYVNYTGCAMVFLQTRVFRLPDLWVRPGFGGKGRKLPGTLEAHQNGFRYQTPKVCCAPG